MAAAAVAVATAVGPELMFLDPGSQESVLRATAGNPPRQATARFGSSPSRRVEKKGAVRASWAWRSLDISHAELLRPYFAASLGYTGSCETYFSDLVHRPYEVSFAFYGEFLMIRRLGTNAAQSGENAKPQWFLVPPLFTLAQREELEQKGELGWQLLRAMVAALEQHPGASFDVVSDQYISLLGGVEALQAAGIQAQLTCDDEWDYIYRAEALRSMSESKGLKEKRRQAKKFEKTQRPAVTVLKPSAWSKDLYSRCLQVVQRWYDGAQMRFADQAAGENSHGVEERRARCTRDHQFTLELLKNFERHEGLRGVLIEIQGEAVGIAIVEIEKGGRMLLSHVEKSLLTKARRGIYPFTRRAYLDALADTDVEFVNAEQDIGDPGLRSAKKRYKPVEMRRKWILTSAFS